MIILNKILYANKDLLYFLFLFIDTLIDAFQFILIYICTNLLFLCDGASS